MEPIKYADALNDHYGSMGHPAYRWSINETAPLHIPGKPLNQCTVSLLTSGGVSQCSMAPFNPDARNDHRLDTIAQNVDANDFQIHDSYYDHKDAEQDINCIFPLERLRDIADNGTIGDIAARLWSGFMGRIYDRTRILEESAPAFADALAEDGVDILLAAPS